MFSGAGEGRNYVSLNRKAFKRGVDDALTLRPLRYFIGLWLCDLRKRKSDKNC